MDFLDFITKPPNFYEWLKFKKISIPSEEIPLYRLDVSGYEGGNTIPSIGTNSAPFIVGTTKNSGYPQIGYENGKFFISDYAYIYHDIDLGNEFDIKAKLKIDVNGANVSGDYNRIWNDHTNDKELFWSSSYKLKIIFGTQTTSYLTASGDYGSRVSGGGIVCDDIDESFLNDFHVYELAGHSHRIYFYIDNVLVGSQSLINYPKFALGDFDTWNNAKTPKIYIDSLDIYDHYLH